MTETKGSPEPDIMLLRGLEPAMSSEEQQKVTALMTSGDTSDLAQAAFILFEIGNLLKQGVTPAGRSAEQQEMVHRSLQRRYAGEKEGRNRLGFNNREHRVAELKAKYDAEKKKNATALPLPVRMPRFAVIAPFDPDGVIPPKKTVNPKTWSGKPTKPSLAFLDDEWDGTIGDAFTKIQVKKNDSRIKKLVKGENVNVVKELKPSPGFDQIVHAGWGGGYEMRLADPEPRVLICDSMHDAAKKGLHRGDVVTHVNGKEFKGTADDLNKLMKELSEAEDIEEMTIVVNAEESIAEALALRSVSFDERSSDERSG